MSPSARLQAGEGRYVLTGNRTGRRSGKDILAQMGFRPIISDSPKIMDERIFIPGKMNCFHSHESNMQVSLATGSRTEAR
jgi:hypothetical protein